MRTLVATLSCLAFAGALGACGGDDGGDAAEALCEDDTIDAIDSLFVNNDDVPDFDEVGSALDVVAEASEGDLDDEVDAVQEALDALDEALEGVDTDDDDAVDEALAENLDEDDFDQEELDDAEGEILEFVDDECDTDLAEESDEEEAEEDEAADDEAADDEAASGDFCAQAERLAEDDTLDDLDITDPDDVLIALGVLEEFRDSAPDEVRADLDRVVEAFVAIEEIVRETEGDPAAQEEAFNALDEEFADVEQATEAVETFALEECGVDISGDDETDAGSAGGTVEEGSAGEPDDPPAIDDPALADLAERCFEGSGQACDDLFFQSPVDSEAEDYGDTCGGRFDESPGLCSEAIGG